MYPMVCLHYSTYGINYLWNKLTYGMFLCMNFISSGGGGGRNFLSKKKEVV